MEYNTSREQLIIPEYGRAIQQMVEQAKALESREERSRAARTIVNAMAILNPQMKDMTDYRHKLWDHLFIISGFELDCESPYPMPDKDLTHVKPTPVKYPQKNIKLRHYGSIIESMIREAKNMEDGPQKTQAVEMIAGFMKMSYLTWNRDTVSDELIKDQVKELSGGILEVPEELKLSNQFIDLSVAGGRKNQNQKNRQGKKRNGYNNRGK